MPSVANFPFGNCFVHLTSYVWMYSHTNLIFTHVHRMYVYIRRTYFKKLVLHRYWKWNGNIFKAKCFARMTNATINDTIYYTVNDTINYTLKDTVKKVGGALYKFFFFYFLILFLFLIFSLFFLFFFFFFFVFPT